MGVIIISFFVILAANAVSLKAAEGGCAECESRLGLDAGVGQNSFFVLEGVSRNAASRIGTSDQMIICGRFKSGNYNSMKAKLDDLNLQLHEVYDQIECNPRTRADLIRDKTAIPSSRGDLMSFIRYYVRERNDRAELERIFNRVIDNPSAPRGTLIDFINFYSVNPNHTDNEREEFRRYVEIIRRFGGKTEAELTN